MTYPTDHTDNNAIYIWVSPPSVSIPVTGKELRFAIGTPEGRSTNSWKVRVNKEDTYIACRDNFKELKVSLHASGTWRLAFTESFAKARPDLVPPEKDRVWKKWSPVLDDSNRAVVAFQILAPNPTLYLAREERKVWNSKVLFVEPTVDAASMTVVSVVVVLGQLPLTFPQGTKGVVFGVLPLGNDRTVQLVAMYEPLVDTLDQIANSIRQIASQLGGTSALPEQGVLFVTGDRGNDTCWVTAARYARKERQGQSPESPEA